jgi:hypothetical protein
MQWWGTDVISYRVYPLRKLVPGLTLDEACSLHGLLSLTYLLILKSVPYLDAFIHYFEGIYS